MRPTRLFATFLLTASALLAAETGVVPERAAWVVEISVAPSAPDTPSQGAPRQPVRIESVKAGTLKRDIIHFSDGTREEYWFAKGFLFSLNPDGQSASVLEYKSDRVAENESGASPGFPGLWWIKGQSPAEVVERDGRRLLHFMRESIPVGTPLMHAVTEVWIDEATGKPVEASTPVGSLRYTHQPPPAADLAMPTVFRDAAEKAFRRAARREELRGALQKQ